jgi:hypothetical protein
VQLGYEFLGSVSNSLSPYYKQFFYNFTVSPDHKVSVSDELYVP